MKEETAAGGSTSPSKIDNKKRGHVKDDPDSEAPEDEPPAKKTKARAKKEPKIKDEGADGGSENEVPTAKQNKPRIKKEAKIKNENAETTSEIEEPAKETKAAIKKGKKAKGDEADEHFKHDTQPVKKGRKQAKKAAAGDEAPLHVKDESSDHDALPSPIVKKAQAPRKSATAKKIKDEDTETNGLDPASELDTALGNVKLERTSELEAEASQDVPKPQKGRTKATKKAVNGTVEETNQERNPKVRLLVA